MSMKTGLAVKSGSSSRSRRPGNLSCSRKSIEFSEGGFHLRLWASARQATTEGEEMGASERASERKVSSHARAEGERERRLTSCDPCPAYTVTRHS